jgi:hypothetical protein
MRRSWLLASSAVILALLSAAAEGWGSAVNGVRMEIAFIGDTHSGVRITVQNTGNQALLLPAGTLIGDRFYDLRFEIVVSVPGGQERRAVYAGGPGAIGGRVDPLIIPLIPGASYTVEIPIARFLIPDKPEKLETLIGKRCQFRAELNLRNPACPLYGYPNPNMVPCWQGDLASNVLRLPD